MSFSINYMIHNVKTYRHNILNLYKTFIPVVWRSRHSVQGERLVLQRAQAGLLHPALSHHLPPDQVTPGNQ